MLQISSQIALPESEVEMRFIRSQGPGGQNVNKLSTAVHLRFDIRASSLPETVKNRLLNLRDRRINSEGYIIIKAQQFRSQEKNRADALQRLVQIIQGATQVSRKRRATRPSKAARNKRMDQKTQRGRTKTLRGRVAHP